MNRRVLGVGVWRATVVVTVVAVIGWIVVWQVNGDREAPHLDALVPYGYVYSRGILGTTKSIQFGPGQTWDDASMAELVRHLKALRDLEVLWFKDDTLSDSGCGLLVQLKTLRRLSLRGNKRISDKGLFRLAELATLEELDVLYTSVTDEGVAKFRSLRPSVRVLWW